MNSSVPNFIAELVRAANQVERLTTDERIRLLARALVSVQEMRQSISIPSAQPAAEKIVDLQRLVVSMGALAETPEEVREALITAAAMIRDLHIVLDTRSEIGLRQSAGLDRSET
jgi:hypothetical protein